MKIAIPQKASFMRLGFRHQAGLTLVELMIAITLGLFLMGALTSLLSYQTASRDEFDKSSRQIENGRYAMQVLHDDIELAGYYGQFFGTLTPAAGLPDPCVADLTSLNAGMPLPIQGYDAPTSGAVAALPTCIAAANYLRGDILVIHRADTSTTTMAAAAAGSASAVYMQSVGSQYVLNTGSNANAATFNLTYTTSTATVSAALRPYIVRIYFISPCSNMANGSTCTANDDNKKPIPTLKRLELNSNGGFTLTPLVEGVENVQFDYGIDSDGDGYPDSYITTPATTTDWSNVVAIRVNLLSRNNDASANYSDSKTYTMDPAASGASAVTTVGPTGDQYKRHAYSAVVSVINVSGRRAQQ